MSTPKKVLGHEKQYARFYKKCITRVSLLDMKMEELVFKHNILKKKCAFYQNMAQRIENLS